MSGSYQSGYRIAYYNKMQIVYLINLLTMLASALGHQMHPFLTQTDKMDTHMVSIFYYITYSNNFYINHDFPC